MNLHEIRIESLTYEVLQRSERRKILDNISYRWQQGTTYALWGASGSGKSTLLHMVAGFQQPTAGTIWYGERDHRTLSEHERDMLRLHTISYVVQRAPLIPEFSVIENVMMNGLIAGVPHHECRKRAQEVLNEIGLYAYAEADPLTLSGGEQQRVALGRALWSKPQWLLLDEPTAHLDERSKHEIMSLLLKVHKEYGTGMIIATHDNEVMGVLQEKIVLADGRIQG